MNRKTIKTRSLKIKYPKLAKEWHPVKNGKLTPRDITPGSGRKVWWKCVKGHAWEDTISHRRRGDGCPYCSGHRVCKENSLAAKNGKLAKEWHPVKNGSLTPRDVVNGSNRKVWWSCENGHEWQTNVGDRSIGGRGCPYCSGNKFSKERSLALLYPEIAKEWHPVKNGELTPYDVPPGAGRRKVWWICKSKHVWKAVIASRNAGAGCPYCSHFKASPETSLAVLNPGLAKEWHPTKNGELTPCDLTSASSSKVWWKCKKGHEWNAAVSSRSKGSGCPYCSGYKIAREASLQVLNPLLVREWHPSKNNSFTPYEVSPVSQHKVWWICSKGHVYEMSVQKRNKGVKCPYCENRKVCDDNCLATVKPELAKEWHPVKNVKLTPKDVTLSFSKKVWWKCKSGHEWEAPVRLRKYYGCKECYIALMASLRKRGGSVGGGIAGELTQKLRRRTTKGSKYKGDVSINAPFKNLAKILKKSTGND